MDAHALEGLGGAGASEDGSATETAVPRALHPDFGNAENWHDLAERGTPRNG